MFNFCHIWVFINFCEFQQSVCKWLYYWLLWNKNWFPRNRSNFTAIISDWLYLLIFLSCLMPLYKVNEDSKYNGGVTGGFWMSRNLCLNSDSDRMIGFHLVLSLHCIAQWSSSFESDEHFYWKLAILNKKFAKSFYISGLLHTTLPLSSRL